MTIFRHNDEISRKSKEFRLALYADKTNSAASVQLTGTNVKNAALLDNFSDM